MKLNNPYHSEGSSDLPPPPILLSRSDNFMTFKPAPFDPEKEQVRFASKTVKLEAENFRIIPKSLIGIMKVN